MSTPEEHDRLFRAFDALCDLDDDVRAEELERLRRQDPPFAAALVELLGQDVPLSPTSDFTAAIWRAAEAATETDRRGERIGRFTLLELLGQGGMGVVYSAFDDQLERRVAVKLIRSPLPEEHERARLLREARAMAQLSHPNVVPVFEVDTAGDDVFLAMEYVRGQTLRDWANAEPRKWRQVVRVYREAGAGLAAAHDAGLVHRDFKPDNVLIGEDGRPRVLDFGLARTTTAVPRPEPEDEGQTLSQSVDEVTGTGAVMGTPAYMSPEQFMGKSVDARTDQFAFCVALHEALYRERPFKGRNAIELMATVMDGEIPPAKPGTAVPKWVRSVVLRGLAVDADQRYASMTELLADLGRDPQARIRRWTWGVSALGVAGFAAYGGAALADDAAPCAGGPEELDGVWGASQRTAVAEAFGATALPYAPDASTHVVENLDRYAEAWIEGHTEACEATRIREDQSVEHMELRMLCLERRKWELRALVRVLEDADAGVVYRSASAVGALGEVERCAERDYVRATVRPPEDAEVEARARELEEGRARAVALVRTGKYDDALAAARDLVPRAHELGYPPTLARILYLHGRTLQRMGEFESALPAYREAYLTALGVGDDVAATYSARSLAGLVGRELDDTDRAMEWIAYARALGQRPAVGEMAEVLLTRIEAAIHMNKGDFEAAAPLARRAVARIEKVAPGSPDTASTYTTLGNLEVRLGNIPAAIRAYERVVELGRRDYGPNHPAVGSAMHNLAGAYVAAGDLRKALDVYDETLVTLQHALGPEHPTVIAVTNNIGSVRSDVGDYDIAIELQTRAIEGWEKAYGREHSMVANGLNNLGVTYRRMRRYEDALTQHQRALAIREATLDPQHQDLGTTLHNLGTTHHDQGNYELALQYHQRALELWEGKFGAEHPDTAASHQNIGGVLADLERYDEALAHLERAREIWESKLGPDHADVADALQNLAKVHRHLGRLAEAWDQGERSLQIREAALGADHPKVAEVLHLLGLVRRDQGRHDEAIALLRRVLEIVGARPEATVLTRARASLHLAQELDRTGRGGPEVDALAADAEAGFVAGGRPQDAEDARRWLAERS